MDEKVVSLVNYDEIDRYEDNVRLFLNGGMDGERFMAFRLQHGIYGQRQDGVQMVRIKLPGGGINPAQLRAVADVVEKYSQHGTAHVTTRQDFQVHYIPLKDTPAVMRHLGEAGLTTREACGNTVRNISACALAGVCPHEHTDVEQLARHAAQRFLRHPLTQHLPRKFKISFSGCESDCAQGMIHDLAVVARQQNGRFGFKVMAGGGLGHKPHEAVTVEEFIEEKDLLPVMEAVISLHHRYSDRKRRAKARIKFLVDRFGPEGFVEKYREEAARTRLAYANQPYKQNAWKKGADGNVRVVAGAPRKVLGQKQNGLSIFPISLPIGDITVAQLRGVADLMDKEHLSDIRATQDQNLALCNVPNDRIAAIRSGLNALGLGEPKTGDDVVACPGTSTCRLGITSSTILGPKLSGGKHDLRVRVSGCHNGCAQPESGDIGIYGEGARLHGKLIPHYQMYFGGDGRNGGGIGFKGPSVPSARIQAAVQRVEDTFDKDRSANETFFNWTRRKGKEYFADLLQDLTEVAPEQIESVLNDHGDRVAFKVLQLGGGECAGAAQDLVASNFSEASYERDCRNSFASQRKFAEALECIEQIGRLVGQSLLFVSGLKQGQAAADIAASLQTAAAPANDMGRRLAEILGTNEKLKANFDNAGYLKHAGDIDQWMRDAAAFCQDIDKQLDLSASLPSSQPAPASQVREIDLSTYGCPLHYIKARNALKTLDIGNVVEFIVDSPESARKLGGSLEADGHFVLSVDDNDQSPRVTVQKSREVAAVSN